MKPSMTRWNTVPLKYGCVTLRPDRGSVHSFDPSANPVKFATVFGVSVSYSRAVKFPSLVVKCAYTMARSYRYLHYDVFTDRLFGGNQLAVVLDGRGLPTETMQAIAKEMNFSETTFALARCGVIAHGRRNFVFAQNAGPTPVTMTWKGDDLSFVWMMQALPSFG